MKHTLWSLRWPLLGAGLILAVAAGLAYAVRLDLITLDTSKRLSGAAMGLVLVVIGNNMPKKLTPLSETRCGVSRGQSMQRFAGWTFVLAGLGYSIAWLVAPFEYARTLAMAICGFGVLLVLAVCAWAIMTKKPNPPPAES